MIGTFKHYNQNIKIANYIRKNYSIQTIIKSDYVTTANIEVDHRTTFEGAVRLFKREVNNSNLINEMKRRRYHEEAWMMRRRKEKERTMKRKFSYNVMSFDEKNPLSDSTIFAHDYGISDSLLNPSGTQDKKTQIKKTYK